MSQQAVEFGNVSLFGEYNESGQFALHDGRVDLLYVTPVAPALWNPREPKRITKIFRDLNRVYVIVDSGSPDVFDPTELVVTRDNNTYENHATPILRTIVGRDELMYYDGPLLYAGDSSMCDSHQVCLCVACGHDLETCERLQMSDPWAFVVITKTEYEDICAGVLDIGWVFRNTQAWLYDCSVYAPLGIVPVKEPVRVEPKFSDLLPSLDFFLQRHTSLWALPDPSLYPRCVTCSSWKPANRWCACTSPFMDEGAAPHPHGVSYEHHENGVFYTGPEYGCINHSALKRH
jgi:hypothetical protein